jgi:membrane-bound inhibitor of C-type lysozyme
MRKRVKGMRPHCRGRHTGLEQDPDKCARFKCRAPHAPVPFMQLALRLLLTAALCAQCGAAAFAQGTPANKPRAKAQQPKEVAQSSQIITAAQLLSGNVALLYLCENGARILATFPKKVALITAGEDTYRLKTAPSTSGTKYAAGPISFETQKNTAIFDQHGAVTRCKKLP